MQLVRFKAVQTVICILLFFIHRSLPLSRPRTPPSPLSDLLKRRWAQSRALVRREGEREGRRGAMGRIWKETSKDLRKDEGRKGLRKCVKGNAALTNMHITHILHKNRPFWWGGNVMGADKHPIDVKVAALNDRVVYAPHIYGPDVSNMYYFDDFRFPNNLKEVRACSCCCTAGAGVCVALYLLFLLFSSPDICLPSLPFFLPCFHPRYGTSNSAGSLKARARRWWWESGAEAATTKMELSRSTSRTG